MHARSVLVAGAIALVTITGVIAADITTLATLAIEGAIGDLVRDYGRSSGHQVTLTFDTGPNMQRRVSAGEAFDVLIGPAAVIDEAARNGRVVAGAAEPIGKIAIGVAVRKGARVPDVSTADSLKAAILAADAVFYSQGTSGAHVQKVFGELGVGEAIRSKGQQLPNGGEVMQRLVTGRGNQIGFTMVPEIRFYEPKGGLLVAPLPPSLQNYTTYTAAVMTTSRNREASAGFVRYMSTPAAKRVLAAAGWE